MGMQMSFNPSAGYAGMGSWAGPGGGAPPGYALGGQGIGYNPAIVENPNLGYNAPGAVNTGNEFLGGVPAYPPQPFDAPLQQPTMFNMQPYVETFNTAFPTTMNPAYNIDNITNVAPTLLERLFSQWLTGGTSPFSPGSPQNGNE